MGAENARHIEEQFIFHASQTNKRVWKKHMSLTYSCKSIYPFGYPVSRQLVTDIRTEMVTVLDNQVICITTVVCRLAFHKLPNLERIQACCAHKDWLSKLETRTLTRVNFKDATCRVVMGSKGIFHTVNCKHKPEYKKSFAKWGSAGKVNNLFMTSFCQKEMHIIHWLMFTSLEIHARKCKHQNSSLGKQRKGKLPTVKSFFFPPREPWCSANMYNFREKVILEMYFFRSMSRNMYREDLQANLPPQNERYQCLPSRHSHL